LSPVAVMLVTIAALFAAWSVMVTARLTLTYSGERFEIPQAGIGPLRWRHLMLFGLLAAPITPGVVYETIELWGYMPRETNPLKIAAFAPGIIIAFLLLWVADLARRLIDSPATNLGGPALLMPRKRPSSDKIVRPLSEAGHAARSPGWLARRVLKISKSSGRGYVDYEGDLQGRFPLNPGHGGALAMLLTFMALYAAIGVVTSPPVSPRAAPLPA